MRIIFLFVGFIVVLFSSCKENTNTSSKSAYINSVKVFEEFSMKLEYDSILQTDLTAESFILDSLDKRIKFFESMNKIKDINTVKNEYKYYQDQYNQKFQQLANNYTSKVNQKLNEYIKSYGDSMNYDFIFGTNGSGNIMYSKKNLDITDSLVNYINKEYSK